MSRADLIAHLLLREMRHMPPTPRLPGFPVGVPSSYEGRGDPCLLPSRPFWVKGSSIPLRYSSRIRFLLSARHVMSSFPSCCCHDLAVHHDPSYAQGTTLDRWYLHGWESGLLMSGVHSYSPSRAIYLPGDEGLAPKLLSAQELLIFVCCCTA